MVVLAIAVPIALAFLAGGPGSGVAVGALVAVAIVVVAVRQRPRGALGQAAAGGAARRLLVVVCCPLEEPAAIAEIASVARSRDGSASEVMVLAPLRIGFLDRWASDLEGARREAQRGLVITVAALAKAGVTAEARVGDEDVVQAVEDQLGSFDATEVILVSAGEDEDPAAAAAGAELEQRRRAGFRRLLLSGPAAR
jgi:hypothetical protein